MNLKTIKYLVFTPDLKDEQFVKDVLSTGCECFPVIDARSAIYVATGIAAQNKEPVIVCIKGSNESRSAFSGMTEAFYRNLPIVLITYGISLDYSTEIKDVVQSHIVIENESELNNCYIDNYPIHIEIKKNVLPQDKLDYKSIHVIASFLTSDDYLYLSNNFIDYITCSCKLARGGMPYCDEGALSNVLGASLSKRHNRYVGIVSENEFIHDMNTLGNINVNESLLFVVYAKNNLKLISDYSSSLGFKVEIIKENEIQLSNIKTLITEINKTVLIVNQGD